MSLAPELLSIVIPAYNEEESLHEFLPEVISFCSENNYKLIVVNDGSKDETKSICETLFSNQGHCSLINNKLNKGYGGAIKTGIQNTNTKYVITIDADGQHFLPDVKSLLKKVLETDADMIVGSRKGHADASLYRGIGKKLIRKFTNILIKTEVYDINSGMKIYNTKLGKKYLNLCPNGMSYSDTILLCFVNFRHKVLEEPITIKSRISGVSTIGTKTAIETVREIFNLVILFNPLNIFLPVSMFLFICSITWGATFVIEGKGITVGTMLGFVLSVLTLSIGLLAEQISNIRKSQVLLSDKSI